MSTIAEIQTALIKRNFLNDKADGVWGRKSIGAMKQFQSTVGLPITGIADDASVRALLPGGVGAPPPPWYAELLRFKGLREGAGAANNPTIIGWAKALGGWVAQFYTKDSIAWCGLTVGHCISTTLPHEPLPNNPLGALEWKKFGVPLREDQLTLGAVLVFDRPPKPTDGHVGFYAGEDDSRYYVLSGNQKDSVSIVPVAKKRCVAIRWPSTVALPAPGRIRLSSTQAASSNEA